MSKVSEALRREHEWLHRHGLGIRYVWTLTTLDVTDIPPPLVDPSLTGWPACAGHCETSRAEVFCRATGAVKWAHQCEDPALAMNSALAYAHAELDDKEQPEHGSSHFNG